MLWDSVHDNGDAYFLNVISGATQWEDPRDIVDSVEAMSHVDVDSGVTVPTALHDLKITRGGVATDRGGLIDHAAAKRSDGTAGEINGGSESVLPGQLMGILRCHRPKARDLCLAMSMVDI